MYQKILGTVRLNGLVFPCPSFFSNNSSSSDKSDDFKSQSDGTEDGEEDMSKFKTKAVVMNFNETMREINSRLDDDESQLKKSAISSNIKTTLIEMNRKEDNFRK